MATPDLKFVHTFTPGFENLRALTNSKTHFLIPTQPNAPAPELPNEVFFILNYFNLGKFPKEGGGRRLTSYGHCPLFKR